MSEGTTDASYRPSSRRSGIGRGIRGRPPRGGNTTVTERRGDGRPIIRRITRQPRDWASELRRLHGRGGARARPAGRPAGARGAGRSARRAFGRVAALVLAIAGLAAAIVVIIVVFA
jgi:hypothetical protein